MTHLDTFNPENATGEHKELFDQINSAFGTVPNMFKTIGNSPAALKSMFGFFGALGSGVISAQLGEQLAVYIANLNRCTYCLSAHTLLGKNAGVSAEDMASAQQGKSNDHKTQAALVFAGKVVKQRAQITKNDVSDLRNAGFSSEEIAEILAHIALNIFTNYTNEAFKVENDFPPIHLS